MSNTPYLPVFATPKAEAETMASYRAVLARWPVPYSELTVPTTFGDTHVIASGPEGAPPVILLHAFFASALAWQFTAGALSSEFRVYAVDLIGEPGPSRAKIVIKTIEEQMQYLRDLTDALGAPKADFVGNSFGAFFSLTYALRMPERVRKLVLVGPASTIHGMPAFYLKSFMPKMLYMFLPWFPGLKRLLLRSVDWLFNGAPVEPQWAELFRLLMLHGSVARYLFPAVYPPEVLRQVTTPTLLLIGDKEVIYSVRAAVHAAEQSIPNLQTAIIPNANHFVALSQPELANAKIREFLCRD
jgi:pimeloyl-ACP methyl ester carboxylesterase